MSDEKQIIEINGVKMEVDLRHAKVIHDNIRVGSKVKVMVKSTYVSPEVYAGVVVGFEPFPDLPTIIVAYVVETWNEAKLEFAYINPGEKSAEKYALIPAIDDELPINRATVIGAFDREIAKHERAIAEVREKRAYFEARFGQWFERAEVTEPA